MHAGIFPDILHILDLQISVDAICSALLDYTDTAGVAPGGSRDARLAAIGQQYSRWCCEEGLEANASMKDMSLLIVVFLWYFSKLLSKIC